ncbi:MAG: AAA family ATPase [Bacteriovoracaceae bacterium]|nr:AAA family ATPase [Bacteriovoracaceae bacterium]
MYINPIEGEKFPVERWECITGGLGQVGAKMLSLDEVVSIMSKRRTDKGSLGKHIFIGSNKGGVGKTMTSIQLAWTLVMKGYKVLYADMDPQANMTYGLLEDEEKTEADLSFYEALVGECKFEEIKGEVCDTFHLIGANSNLSEIDHYLRTKLEKGSGNFFDNEPSSESEMLQLYKDTYALFKELGRKYDFVIYDTNPETNAFNRISMQMADIAIVPIQPKEASVKGYGVTRDEIIESVEVVGRSQSEIKNKIKILLNEAQPIPLERREKLVGKIRDFFGSNVLNSEISFSFDLGEASDLSFPAIAFEGVSNNQLEELNALAEEVIELAIKEKITRPRRGRFAEAR